MAEPPPPPPPIAATLAEAVALSTVGVIRNGEGVERGERVMALVVGEAEKAEVELPLPLSLGEREEVGE